MPTQTTYNEYYSDPISKVSFCKSNTVLYLSLKDFINIAFDSLGGLEESKKFLSALKLVTLAESLGGYESLAELPYLMTHASIEEKERVALGVTNNLIRLSVGLENPQDIVEDIDQALKAACQ